jgi:hypothetical protein
LSGVLTFHFRREHYRELVGSAEGLAEMQALSRRVVQRLEQARNQGKTVPQVVGTASAGGVLSGANKQDLAAAAKYVCFFVC